MFISTFSSKGTDTGSLVVKLRRFGNFWKNGILEKSGEAFWLSSLNQIFMESRISKVYRTSSL